MITTKKHNEIVNKMEVTVVKYHSKIEELEISLHESMKREAELKEDLKNAKDLKEILGKVGSLFGSEFLMANGSAGYALNLPDTVLQYTEDILGGKVIKQEGNKCLIIDKEGKVKTGLTKEKVDKGYSYKLIRE